MILIRLNKEKGLSSWTWLMCVCVSSMTSVETKTTAHFKNEPLKSNQFGRGDRARETNGFYCCQHSISKCNAQMDKTSLKGHPNHIIPDQVQSTRKGREIRDYNKRNSRGSNWTSNRYNSIHKKDFVKKTFWIITITFSEIQITNNLLSGQSYDFTITAQNGAGLSVESDILAVDMKAPGMKVLFMSTELK